jgi:archaellum component FlaC
VSPSFSLAFSRLIGVESFLKRVAGIKKLDDGLQKLDKMTNEEARMPNAEVLRLAHNIDEKVGGVDNKVQSIGNQVNEVDEKVQGINKHVQVVSVQVQDVDENVKIVEEKVQTVIDGARTVLNMSPSPSLVLIVNRLDGKEAATEAKLAMRKIAHNVDDVNRSSSVLSSISQVYNMSTGRQMRESLRKWQSPSDPSINHNIACSLQHEGTALWFCGGDIFEEWKVTGSLLWVHGKRTFFLPVIPMSDKPSVT